MLEKRMSPLKNPPQEKSPVVAPVIKNYKTPGTLGGREIEKGVSKGGKERDQPVEALLKCLQCGRIQKLVFLVRMMPKYHRCIWCKELQPTDGFRVVGYGLGIPQPLAPFQMEARAREAALTAEYNPHG